MALITKRSPCRNCELRDIGKSNAACVYCDDRAAYARQVVQDDGLHREPIGGNMGKAWSKAELGFIEENKDQLTNRQIGEALSRSVAAVAGGQAHGVPALWWG